MATGVISALLGLLAAIVTALAWLFKLKSDNALNAAIHKAHEDLCTLRQVMIGEKIESVEKRMLALEKVGDSRHTENRQHLALIDQKLDQLLRK